MVNRLSSKHDSGFWMKVSKRRLWRETPGIVSVIANRSLLLASLPNKTHHPSASGHLCPAKPRDSMRHFRWEVSEGTSGVLLEFHGREGEMRSRGCCEALVASRIAPPRRSAPRCSHPAPGKSWWSSGCVGSSDVWSLTQHFTHSLLTGARFAQAASVGAGFPSLLQSPAN